MPAHPGERLFQRVHHDSRSDCATVVSVAVVTGLFLTLAVNPVYAGLFDFKLGGDKDAGTPVG